MAPSKTSIRASAMALMYDLTLAGPRLARGISFLSMRIQTIFERCEAWRTTGASYINFSYAEVTFLSPSLRFLMSSELICRLPLGLQSIRRMQNVQQAVSNERDHLAERIDLRQPARSGSNPMLVHARARRPSYLDAPSPVPAATFPLLLGVAFNPR